MEQLKQAVNCNDSTGSRDYSNPDTLTEKTNILNDFQINPALFISISDQASEADTFDESLWPYTFVLSFTCEQIEITTSLGIPKNITQGYWSL
jgi:hypothetical protein